MDVVCIVAYRGIIEAGLSTKKPEGGIYCIEENLLLLPQSVVS
jgi:hypothetical protein